MRWMFFLTALLVASRRLLACSMSALSWDTSPRSAASSAARSAAMAPARASSAAALRSEMTACSSRPYCSRLARLAARASSSATRAASKSEARCRWTYLRYSDASSASRARRRAMDSSRRPAAAETEAAWPFWKERKRNTSPAE